MTAVEIKEDKRMKLLNWGCSGVSRGGWLGLEHFHCTSESNREYRANSRCLLPRFSRSYRFKQKLHVSALRPVSGDKEEEQDENEAGDLIISGGNALFFMPASNPSLCHWVSVSAAKFKCRCTTLRSSGRLWPFEKLMTATINVNMWTRLPENQRGRVCTVTCLHAHGCYYHYFFSALGMVLRVSNIKGTKPQKGQYTRFHVGR